MVKFGKWIAKHKVIVVAICMLLLIPSVIGLVTTRINYDLLSYLPESLETVEGQDIMVDKFGMGAFSMIVVEDMPAKDTQKLKETIKSIDHVEKVLWYDDLADITVPTEMLPQKIQDVFIKGDATMMIALFDNTTSSDEAMEAITEIRKVTGEQCFASGMSGVVTDIKNLCLQELPIYVVIAAILSFWVLALTMDSLIVPLLFLFSIGVSIVYNMGSNAFLGDVSYVTQALTAVLQLGVTMDYSIFLLDSYEANKKRFPGDNQRAMAHAISNTFKSITASSITTVAGFLALCGMTFALGRNIGIVMSKGVIIGVICCITFLPALILMFDKVIDKTRHKVIMPDMSKLSLWITKHAGIFLVIFAVLLLPAIYGNNHTKIYYKIDKSLPSTLDSAIANEKLKEDFDMSNMHILLLKDGLTAREKQQMLSEMEDVDGVKWAVGMDSFVGPAFPQEMLPDKVSSMLKSGGYELCMVCSDYETATDEVNAQIDSLQKILKSYSPESMIIGEAPLTKDLQDVTDVDLNTVNILSIAAIFVIIMISFKSISLPIILVAVIEFAIFVNMAIPYYTGVELPFVASIVIGTIQLGATVDYAILMTSTYQKMRIKGLDKHAAIQEAHKSCMKSIVTSGLSFFAATFGVCVYSKIDMISSICTLLSRGALISMAVVICILPAMLWVFDPLICVTTLHFTGKKEKTSKNEISKEQPSA